MPIEDAEIIENSAIYSSEAPVSTVANALTQSYAVMLSGNEGIVTRWDYLELLKP